MQLLDGKKISDDIKNEITAEVLKMKQRGEKVPHLAAIIVGNDVERHRQPGGWLRSSHPLKKA